MHSVSGSLHPASQLLPVGFEGENLAAAADAVCAIKVHPPLQFWSNFIAPSTFSLSRISVSWAAVASPLWAESAHLPHHFTPGPSLLLHSSFNLKSDLSELGSAHLPPAPYCWSYSLAPLSTIWVSQAVGAGPLWAEREHLPQRFTLGPTS